MKTFSKMLVLLAAAVLLNCKGKDGEPGPAGQTGAQGAPGAIGPQGPAGLSYQQASENGFIKGTIKGIRRDGAPFQEPFEYKIAYYSEGFEKLNSLTHRLSLYRSEKLYLNDGMLGAAVSVLVDHKGAANQTVKFSDFELSFLKTITGSTHSAFYFTTEANFQASKEILPISRANNATYKLIGNGRLLNNNYRSENINGKYYYIFETTEGSFVYFAYSSAVSAYQFEYLINASGTKVTDDATWKGMRYKNDNTAGGFIFITADGTKLHEEVDVPADTQTISNYTYNAATGDLTFDYTIKIDQYRDDNTSLNPVEITGSVKANGLYDGLVARKKL